MAALGAIAAVPVAAAASNGNFLVSPGLGLMIWTLVLFLFTMWVLNKLAFPKSRRRSTGDIKCARLKPSGRIGDHIRTSLRTALQSQFVSPDTTPLEV